MIRPAKTPGTLRFLTLNLWGENGPWQGRISLLLDSVGALEPDVIGLQEVREAPGRVPNHAGEIARRLGWNHVFAPSSAWGGGHEGLAIVSRFPIGAHEAQPLPHSIDTEGRIILSARIDARRWSPFWVHTTHLSYREAEGRKREDQVLFIDKVVAAHANDNVQVVMGDFNAVPDSDEIRWLSGMTTLDGRRVAYQDAWARANVVGSGGTSWPGSPGPARTRTSAGCTGCGPIGGSTTSSRRRSGAIAAAASMARGSCSTSPARPPRASACSSRITSASSRTCRWWRAGPCDALSAAGCSCWRT